VSLRLGMKSPPRYTVDHDVRLESNLDGVELAASVFLPTGWDVAGGKSNKRFANAATANGMHGGNGTLSDERHGVVLVHAHPKLGGTPEMMHGIAADMATHGVAVVNLALRGAGSSGGGTSWRGDNGEVNDVVTACDHARDALGCVKVHLMGYSFGATVCAGAIDKRDFIATYVAVAYPLGHWFSRGVAGVGAKLLMHAHTPSLRETTKPKLFVIGTADAFTSAGATERFAQRCCDPWEVKTHEGADHFAFIAEPWCGRAGSDARRFFQTTRAYVDATVRALRLASVEGDNGAWHGTPRAPARVNAEKEPDVFEEVFEDAASPGMKK